jgi:hypothetical protein
VCNSEQHFLHPLILFCGELCADATAHSLLRVAAIRSMAHLMCACSMGVVQPGTVMPIDACYHPTRFEVPLCLTRRHEKQSLSISKTFRSNHSRPFLSHRGLRAERYLGYRLPILTVLRARVAEPLLNPGAIGRARRRARCRIRSVTLAALVTPARQLFADRMSAKSARAWQTATARR